MSVRVIVTFKSRPENLATFSELLRAAKRELPSVAGCEAVDVLTRVDDPHVFTLVETWRDEASHQAHVQRLVRDGVWSHIEAHLAAPAESAYYTEL